MNNNTSADALAGFANNSGSFTIQNGRNFATAGALANTGLLAVGNPLGGDAASTLTLTGALTGTTGTLRINPNGNVVLGGASTTGMLVHNGNAAGSLALGANNITVSADYTNANSRPGQQPAKCYADVSTTGGRILAAGTTNQTLTGNVSGGTTATPTMTFGNVHVGSVTTQNYQVNDTGVGGPSVRGAIETSVNGGNITDARLTGTGVTAGNFGPIAQGSATGNLAVTFTATTAGALTARRSMLPTISTTWRNRRSASPVWLIASRRRARTRPNP